MNLDELLDVTEPVTVQFMEHEITAHVYTAGRNRMTHEEIELLKPSTNGNGAEEFTETVKYIRKTLPVLVKGIDLDGEPLKARDTEFPDNVKFFPDSLLVEVGNAVIDKWNAQNPTSGVETPNGSQPEEKREQNLIESSTS